jgi:hypothetical protein
MPTLNWLTREADLQAAALKKIMPHSAKGRFHV